jgi:hypothetical protein
MTGLGPLENRVIPRSGCSVFGLTLFQFGNEVRRMMIFNLRWVFLCVNDQEQEQLTSFGLVVVLWFWGAAA